MAKLFFIKLLITPANDSTGVKMAKNRFKDCTLPIFCCNFAFLYSTIKTDLILDL